VILPTGPVRVLIATKPVDFRKGVDGLAALVKEELKTDPFSGVIYVFRAKRADRVKLVFWDGTGTVLVSKRLGEGKFRWPRIEDGLMRLSPAQFGALFEGLDGHACMGGASRRRKKCNSCDRLTRRARRGASNRVFYGLFDG